MESIALLWPDRLVSNLGWTLIHFSWQGTFIALLYALGERWLCRESANRRYAAGCLALAVMVLAPAFTMGHLAASPREATHSVASMVTPPASAPAQTVRTGGPESSGRLIHSSDPNTLIHEISWRVRLGGSLNRLLPWLVRGWAAGVVILSVHLLTGWFKVRRIRGESIPVPHEMWGLKFTALVKTLAVRRPVRLLQSVWIEVPTVIGHFKPVILVPASALTRMSPDQLELLLAHELAHIRRHDYLINTLQTLIEIVLFYHPAVWWVSRRVREEREHCCDDLAVSIGGSRLDYIRALATMEEQRGLSSAWTLGARGGGLVEWIRRLVRPEEPAPSQTGWSLAGLLLLILGVSLTGSCGHSTAPPDESAIAAVRDYLSHPKEIERVVVRYQLLALPTSPNPKFPISSSITNAIQFFRAAWKSNAFYLEQGRSAEDFGVPLGALHYNHGLLLSGRLNDRAWNIVDTNIYSTITQLDPEAKNPIQTGAMLAEWQLTEYLTFGLYHSRPSSLTWTSDRDFVADFNRPDGLVRGALSAGNGNTIRMTVTNGAGRSMGIREISYNPTNKQPSGFSLGGLRNGALIPIFRVEFLALIQATNSLPDAFFAPEQFVDPQYLMQSIYTNGATYDVISNELVRLPRIIR